MKTLKHIPPGFFTSLLALCLNMGISQNANADLKDGLVAHYCFDDPTNIGKDCSTNGNNGELIGQVNSVTGLSGNAANFGGYNNPASIHVPNSPSLQFTNDASISFAVNMTGLDGVTGYGNYGSYGVHAAFAKSHDRQGFIINLSGNDSKQLSSGAGSFEWGNNGIGGTTDNYQVGQWRYFTYVFSNSTHTAKLYADGVLIKTLDTFNQSFESANNQDLYLGKFSDSWYPLNGSLDDVRIYNRALTEAEVMELYNGGGVEEVVKVPEVLNVEPWDTIKNKYTVFTVSGLNLTQDNIEFELDDCVAANRDEEKNFLFRDTTRKFRCMPTSTGEKRGRIYDTKTGELLYSFQMQVAPKLPKVSSVTPTTVSFNSNAIFTVKGLDLSSNLVYSLNNCVNLQELAGGTAKQRSFQCTTKNSTGKQTGSITLSDGTEIKKFSVTVSSKKPPVIKNASLIYDPNIMYSWRVNFPQGELTDIANFSSATPWQIKANGKKIYSGTLGSSFNEQIGFNSGKSTLTLDDGGELEIFWDKKTINFQANKKLNQLVSALTEKSTIEFALGSTKASFVVNVPKTPKQVEVKTAQWSYDARNVDNSNFLTADVIKARDNLLTKYVYADIEKNVRFLDALNMKTIDVNKTANEYAEKVSKVVTALKVVNSLDGGNPNDLFLDGAKFLVSNALKSISKDLFKSKGLEEVSTFISDTAFDYLSGDYIGATENVSKKVMDIATAYRLNNDLERIYENWIAREVIKQYFAKGGSIYDVGSSINQTTKDYLVAKPENRNWEGVIKAVASTMKCSSNTFNFWQDSNKRYCESGYFSEDYNPEAVNQIIQNYLATLRLLSGYGDFYTLNGE